MADQEGVEGPMLVHGDSPVAMDQFNSTWESKQGKWCQNGLTKIFFKNVSCRYLVSSNSFQGTHQNELEEKLTPVGPTTSENIAISSKSEYVHPNDWAIPVLFVTQNWKEPST